MSNPFPIILIVDDDELMREFVVKAVNRLGYAAVAATNPTNALELVNETPSLRILLSDVCLGAGTSTDLIRQALRSRPDLRVVFMSGGFDNIAFRHTDPLLKKPFDLERLRKAIESVLNEPPPTFDDQTPIGRERRRMTVS